MNSIWRIFGWLTVLYVVLGVVLIAFLLFDLGFVSPGPIDWSYVPKHAIVPLWMVKTFYWVPALLAFTVLAPIGFFRHASARPAPRLLIGYAMGTFVILAALVAAPLILTLAGDVPTSNSSGVTFTSADVVGSLVMSIPLGVPAVAALLAARMSARRSEHQGDHGGWGGGS